MDKEVRRRLMKEDEREERELRAYVAQSLASDMINSMPGAVQPEQRDGVKTPAERQQEATARQWSNQADQQPGR